MTTFDEIKEMLKSKSKGKEITMESGLKDLNIDSLELIDIVLSAEEKYNISIADEELFKLKTVADVVNTIDSLIKK